MTTIDEDTYIIFVCAGTSGIELNCWRMHFTIPCWHEHFSGHPIALTLWWFSIVMMMHNAISTDNFIFISFIFIMIYISLALALVLISHFTIFIIIFYFFYILCVEKSRTHNLCRSTSLVVQFDLINYVCIKSFIFVNSLSATQTWGWSWYFFFSTNIYGNNF